MNSSTVDARPVSSTANFPDDAQYAPFIEADANAPAATLRAQIELDGYLFFRAIVPAKEVLRARRDVLELCDEAGWLDRSHDVEEAFADASRGPYSEGMPEYMPVYRRVLKTPSFHDFPAQPALMEVAAKLLDLPTVEVFVHPRRIGRITWPNFAVATTPPHQDHYYIRGSVETYSCWTPLGECPISLGGLAIWPGSHRRGFIEHTVHSPGAVGGCGVPVDEEKATWHTGDFGLGDALFFHSYTIHKALPNQSGHHLRLSTDNRYQRPKDAIDPSALQPHFGG